MGVSAAQISRLRRLVDDRLPANGDDSDAFWTDTDLDGLLVEAGLVMDRAAYLAWQEKSAHYSSLIDISESGSDRRLSQKHTNAARMVEIFRKAAAETSTNSNPKSRLGIVGKVIHLDETDEEDIMIPGEIYEVSGDNIRYFPLKRAGSILR